MRSRSQASRSEPKTETEKRLDAKEAAEYKEVAADKKAVMEDRSSITTKEAAVEKLGDKLDQEQDARDAAKRRAAAEAPRTSEELQQSIGALNMGTHARIVDTLFDMPDPMTEYLAIKASLSFGGRASSMSYGQLIDALDDAQSVAERCSRLVANAKVTLDAFNMDAEVISGVLREQAVMDLQAQKDAGTRSKAITNDDITAVMAKKFPDEFRDLEIKKGKARRMVAAIEALYDRASARAGDLRAMVQRSREVS
jgi:hypothetical protein